jgi:hypothetical protein
MLSVAMVRVSAPVAGQSRLSRRPALHRRGDCCHDIGPQLIPGATFHDFAASTPEKPDPLAGRVIAAVFNRDPSRARQAFDRLPRSLNALFWRKPFGQVTGDKVNARVKFHSRHMPPRG